MRHIYPNFYHKFRCIASSCPDSCCTGWAVVVDQEAAERFRRLPGSLGEALRRAMVTDEDGDLVFRRGSDGRCPFWQADGLCRIQAEAGESALCETCRKFPRLTQDYGSFIEYGLTLSCPVAAELLLGQQGPWVMEVRQDDLPGEETSLDGGFLQELIGVREDLLAELWKKDIPEEDALKGLLSRGLAYQRELDGEDSAIKETPLSPKEKRAVRRELLILHRDLEILTPRWKALLDEALAWKGELPALGETGLLRNLATDHLYRHWLQTADDGDCLTRLLLLAVNWVVVRTLAQVRKAKEGQVSQEELVELVRLYAKEVGHDQVNLEAVEDYLWNNRQECLSLLKL